LRSTSCQNLPRQHCGWRWDVDLKECLSRLAGEIMLTKNQRHANEVCSEC
jgi:hypothetical protein